MPKLHLFKIALILIIDLHNKFTKIETSFQVSNVIWCFPDDL